MKEPSAKHTALAVNNLSKTYATGRSALNNLNFKVKEGDFYALLGRNGAGKSTTIGIVCSLVKKTSGRVQVFGIDIDESFEQAKSHIGLVPQEINFNLFESPWNILINHAGYYGVNRNRAKLQAEKYLTTLELWDHRRSQSKRLSGGMKRKLMIARALMHEPSLLILDEPTAGIDFETRLFMWEFLRELNRQGTTIILTTHYLQEAERLCRNVAIIELGQLIIETDMKSLFTQLRQETYILDLMRPISVLPSKLNTSLRLTDPTTIEADVPRGNNVNWIFKQLSDNGIEIASIQNKSNRLETLFIDLLRSEVDAMRHNGENT